MVAITRSRARKNRRNGAGRLIATRVPFLYRRAKRRGVFPLQDDDAGRGKARNMITQAAFPARRAHRINGAVYDVRSLANLVSRATLRDSDYGVRGPRVPHTQRTMTQAEWSKILRAAKRTGWREDRGVTKQRRAQRRTRRFIGNLRAVLLRLAMYDADYSTVRQASQILLDGMNFGFRTGPHSIVVRLLIPGVYELREEQWE